jgi:hypothetical protein
MFPLNISEILPVHTELNAIIYSKKKALKIFGYKNNVYIV